MVGFEIVPLVFIRLLWSSSSKVGSPWKKWYNYRWQYQCRYFLLRFRWHSSQIILWVWSSIEEEIEFFGRRWLFCHDTRLLTLIFCLKSIVILQKALRYWLLWCATWWRFAVWSPFKIRNLLKTFWYLCC